MKRLHNPSIRDPSSLRGIDRQFVCGGAAVPVIPDVPAEPDLGDGIDRPAAPPDMLAHQPPPGLGPGAQQEKRNAQQT